ncbi:hypothetical protein RJ640_004657 [Escallonia rubra]|uniref:Uncharacterized protein n=1 Tax=Escallonia rubra TaxID=112253 RepID=A0AA88R9W3_9ASTE|nr:hypothetical protein RJ640_004657 [Escallonia rubra]
MLTRRFCRFLHRNLQVDLDMVQTLEAIKGGGGSIKVGTTGTISALMSRELEYTKYAPPTPVSSPNKSPTATFSAPSGASTSNRVKPKILADEASSSYSSNIANYNSPELVPKTKHHTKRTHQIPMLASDNVSLDGTPIRRKPEKKGTYIVEIVDIKCGNPDRAWASPITNRLKKLGFSKLSESIV